MKPIINEGDILSLKELKDWFKFIYSGLIYGLVLNNFAIITRIKLTNNPNEIILIPENKTDFYTPQKINKTDIKRVFKIVSVFKRLV